ncbi:pilus assembly protein [Acidihalobacter prosperus]|uniref:Type IV fimbrial biogenesis protein PilY1 n=1 Tax=Acidihalobacter prosperus TaxID=160660 RepID=A0A1A6C4Q7_9GAMM|nr:PilC/PilY family type IV pilus protein [Acidihalobacter prosperus]OBS09543.1 Type IV fimbrial biogenesis protein PilY1 [Acidihalobacter prosperus]
MKTLFGFQTRWAAPVMAALLLLPATRALAATSYLNLAQAPLTIVQQGIDPNIMFLLDDSGSMQWEWLGDQGSIGAFTYGYPVGNTIVYGSGNYSDYIPGFGASNVYGAQFRSSYVNANYYNPSATYTPWACPAPYPESSTQTPTPTQTATTGNPACHWDSNVNLWVMPNANPNAAFLNPYNNNNPNSNVRALNVWNDSTDSNNNTPNNGYIGNSQGSNNLHWLVDGPNGYEWWTSTYPSGLNSDNNPTGYGFWPAVYWNYIGPRPASNSDLTNIANFQEVQICPPTLSANSNGNTGTCTPPPTLPASPLPYHTYTETDGDYVYIEGDGTQVDRTYAAEMQNFANWFQFYRSHILMARAGAGIAFMQLPNTFRVDFGTINQMATSGNPEFNTTEPFLFSNGNRAGFLQRFYQQPIPEDGTPLRKALKGVGSWLGKQPGASAPWGTSAAEKQANNGANYLTCRANYTVLVTDGTWNGSNPNVGNVDGSTGPTITGPNGQTYQYTPADPYQDGASNTLADVAMYYWENDLQSGMVNDVPTNGEDPAFWQHMVTFAIGLGVTPTLVQAYMQANPGATESQAQAAVYAELQNGTVNWPTPGANSNANIDDLWHAGVDGHGGFLSAQNPQQFASALASTLYQIVARTASGSSVAVNAQKAGEVQTDTQVYQALYHPLNWWGELLAKPILINTTNNQPYVSANANWDASCVLTGGACPAMGTNTQGQATTSVTAQSPSSRVIITDNGTQGVPFEWTSLSSAEQTLLNGADNLGQQRLDYLRGTRSEEEGAGNGGTLRTRTGVLGDIVHSSPVWVGYADQSYPSTPGQPATWTDKLYPSASQPENANAAQTFAQFEANNWSRLNVVYVGANDGMLHGFRAGSYTYNSSTGALTYDATNNDGQEVLAFVPQSVYANINQYTDPQYNHHYYDDATPATGDVFYGGAWHTWLASGLGAGGKELFVLDISNPANFSQANAASLVKADWTTANLTCVNDANCAQDLGDTFGTPVIRRFHNGEWGIIWGNGYNSTNGEAGIFIGLIDPASGAISVYWLGTGYGPAQDPTGQSRPDGIGYTTAVDLDADHITDYVYAGDLFGNVWRFNLTSSNPLDWHVSTYGNTAGTPLFSAVNAAGTAQAITTKVQVVSIPSGLSPGQPQSRLMVLFGTGKLLEPQDGIANTTAAGVQSLYGVWDWDMSNWNSGYTTASGITVPPSATQYASLGTAPSISRSTLLQQTITSEIYSTNSSGTQVGLRQTSQNPVQWADLSYNGTPGTQYGWYLDLVSPVNGYQGEMVVYNPDIAYGVFVVNTTIIGQLGLTCGINNNGGWSMGLDPSDGAMLSFNAFTIQNIGDYNGSFNQATLEGLYAGVTVGAVGSPSWVTYGGVVYMVVSTNDGQTKLIPTGLGGAGQNIRISWRQLR